MPQSDILGPVERVMPDLPGKSLAGRIALVTGGSRGFGLEVAHALIGTGAHVALCARDVDHLTLAGQTLAASARSGQKVRWYAADVTDAAQVEALVSRVLKEFGGLHILVSNAGIYGPFGAIENVDWTEWTRAVEINLHGSVLPIRAVLPHFKAQRSGKIIQLSGGGATNPLPRISAYAASKAAIVRFVETVAGECKDFGIDANSIAPGALNTRLLDEVLAAGPEKVGEQFFARSIRQKEDGGVPMALGTELVVFLASTVSDGITGRLISAVWDKWMDWPAHLRDLDNSDAYTLRRITGHDRGLSWGDK
jgi:NAD(P)-dependent dehydrogenase (short-subunit alcohol dehydrogenase family)